MTKFTMYMGPILAKIWTMYRTLEQFQLDLFLMSPTTGVLYSTVSVKPTSGHLGNELA